MEFQNKIQQFLGHEPKEEKLKYCLGNLIKRNSLIGYKEAELGDPRYNALMNYVRECMPDDPKIKVCAALCTVGFLRDNGDIFFKERIIFKLSQAITRMLIMMTKTSKGKKIYPQQNTIAAPIFQVYFKCYTSVLYSIVFIIFLQVLRNEGHGIQSSTVVHVTSIGCSCIYHLDESY